MEEADSSKGPAFHRRHFDSCTHRRRLLRYRLVYSPAVFRKLYLRLRRPC